MDAPVNTPDTVTSWRLGELERGFKEMRGELKEAVGTLGGGLTALQTQLSTYQTNISDKYVQRRDFDALVKRLEEQENRQSEWGWKLITVALSAGAVIIALVAWLHPFFK